MTNYRRTFVDGVFMKDKKTAWVKEKRFHPSYYETPEYK
jgi:hypothetical protein